MAKGTTLIGFDDRSSRGGSYPVVDGNGLLLASVSPAFWRSQFTATDSEGRPMCSGKARLLSGWRGYDADGAETMVFRARPIRRYFVTLRGSIDCRVIGKAFTRSWFLQRMDTGENLLEGSYNRVGFDPYVWVVEILGDLSLAEAVTAVELNRLEMKKRKRRHPGARAV